MFQGTLVGTSVCAVIKKVVTPLQSQVDTNHSHGNTQVATFILIYPALARLFLMASGINATKTGCSTRYYMIHRFL